MPFSPKLSAPRTLPRARFPRLPIFGRWLALWWLRKLLPISVLKRHGLIVAKSGSGKSELLKLLLLRLKSPRKSRRTVILIDPHGDLAQECARLRRPGNTSDLVFLSPSISKKHVASLNPFDVRGKSYRPEQLEVLAHHLTSAFTAMLSKGDVKLSFTMKTLLTPLLFVLLLRSQRDFEPMTFADLERFLDDQTNHDLLHTGKNLEQAGMRRFFRRLFSDPKFQPTKFSLRVKLLSLVNNQAFATLFCHPHSTWDLSALLDKGKTIIVDTSKTVLGATVSEIYGRTIVALIQSYAFLRGDASTRTPTFLLIDEASSFISEDLKTVLTQARKFGLHLILANQIAKQGGLGTEFYETIMGNTALKVVGNVGAGTRKTMARECDTHEDAYTDLRVGEFVVKANGSPAIRLELPTYWLGHQRAITTEQWNEIRDHNLDTYYRELGKEPHPRQDDIEQDRQPIRSSRGPRFGIIRPFVNDK